MAAITLQVRIATDFGPIAAWAAGYFQVFAGISSFTSVRTAADASSLDASRFRASDPNYFYLRL
jgi:hypothetical protein